MGMVLAVGLVVDDAIVVLENIDRNIHSGLSPFEAALKGAKEIGFAVVMMTLTLASVYAPLIFIEGVVGQLFTEFAIALAGSVVISGVVALTLSPFMCYQTLQASENRWWPSVDVALDSLQMGYKNLLVRIIGYSKACALFMLATLLIIAILFSVIPKATAPSEDRSLIGIWMSKASGQNIDFMENKAKEAESILEQIEHKKGIISFIYDSGANVIVPLSAQSERKDSAQDVADLVKKKTSQLASVDANVWSMDSAIPGVEGDTDGGTISLILSSTGTYKELFDNAEKCENALSKSSIFQSPRHDLDLNSMRYRIDLDENKMTSLGLNLAKIAKTIEIFFSGKSSVDIAKDGVLYPIKVVGKKVPWSLSEIYLTNSSGKPISLAAIANWETDFGPSELFHYNQSRSVTLSATSDLNRAQAMEKLLAVVKNNVSADIKTTWSGSSADNQDAKSSIWLLMGLSIVCIFAILAFQFESFVDPFIILFTVPLASLGGLVWVWFLGGSINIYTQIGLVTLVGLITKHGILIVEFANGMAQTKSPLEAVIEAATIRLRPILMTTGAMIFGSIPLMLSSDEGHEARRAIASVLVGGLGLGTLFTLFVLPMIYVVVKSGKIDPVKNVLVCLRATISKKLSNT
jgi:multidrug efflux pump